jgi:hypothetical protein
MQQRLGSNVENHENPGQDVEAFLAAVNTNTAAPATINAASIAEYGSYIEIGWRMKGLFLSSVVPVKDPERYRKLDRQINELYGELPLLDLPPAPDLHLYANGDPQALKDRAKELEQDVYRRLAESTAGPSAAGFAKLGGMGMSMHMRRFSVGVGLSDFATETFREANQRMKDLSELDLGDRLALNDFNKVQNPKQVIEVLRTAFAV